MAFRSKRFNTDKFVDGTWVNISIYDPETGEYDDGDFKIARAGNPVYEKALESSGYRKMEDSEDKQRALYRAIAIGVLKDWKGVTAEDEKGNKFELPYSVDNATETLIANPDLVGRVLSEANDLANYRREDVAAQKKKRATSKGGSTATSE